MQRTSTIAALIATTFAFAACGGPDKDYDQPLGPSASNAANDALSGISELAASHEAGDLDNLGSAAVGPLFGSATLLIGEKLAAGSQNFGIRSQGALSPDVAANLSDITATADFEDCVTVSDARVDYNACDWGFGTIDGFVSVVGDLYTIDLTMTYNTDSGDSMAINLDGELVINANEIRGNISMDFDFSSGGYDVSYSIDAEYDIDFSSGCPNGTMEIHADFSQPGVASQDIWVLAEFGPACGEVTVR